MLDAVFVSPGQAHGSAAESRDGTPGFTRAVHALLSHAPGVADLLEAAIVAEEDPVAAHALRAFCAFLTGRRALRPVAAAAGRAAAEASHRRGATEDEATLLGALALLENGAWAAAAGRLEARVPDSAQPALLLKLATGVRFMRGDMPAAAAATAAAVRHGDRSDPAYGYILGMHAFALGEAGETGPAEACGRAAVERNADDTWAWHAVAHVLETEARVGEGIAWVEGGRPHWSRAGDFRRHLWWHLALFHLATGGEAKALDLYDAQIAAPASDDPRDEANAVSLLWRLQSAGVSVGPRWDSVADRARQMRRETEWLFATLHRMVALLAVGDRSAAAEALDAVEATGRTGQPEVRQAVSCTALPLAHALLGTTRGVVAPLQNAFAPVGGSVAQRDLFLRILAEGAAAAGDLVLLTQVLALRRSLRAQDRVDVVLSACLDRTMRARLPGRMRQVGSRADA